MKRAWITLTFLGYAAAVGGVEPGESMDQVIQSLGPPHSFVESGERTVYHYDRGRVEFTNGVVSAAELVPEVNVLDERRRAQQQAARQREAQLAAEQNRENAGLALRAEKRVDPVLQHAPPAERFEFWQEFARRYPSVSVERDMEQALERMAFESRQRDQAREEAEMSAFRQQLWDVERRVMQAEMQSAIAREQATLAQVLAAEAVRSAASAQAEDAIDPWAGVAFFDPGFFWRDRPPPAGPAEQKTAPWGRYSVEQRLGPQARPTFGFRGGALAAPSPREQTRR